MFYYYAFLTCAVNMAKVLYQCYVSSCMVLDRVEKLVDCYLSGASITSMRSSNVSKCAVCFLVYHLSLLRHAAFGVTKESYLHHCLHTCSLLYIILSPSSCWSVNFWALQCMNKKIGEDFWLLLAVWLVLALV